MVKKFAPWKGIWIRSPVFPFPIRGTLVCAGASRDRHLYLWNCRTGKQLHNFIEHHSQITAICFHPVEEILYCGNRGWYSTAVFHPDRETDFKIVQSHPTGDGLTIQRSGEYLVTLQHPMGKLSYGTRNYSCFPDPTWSTILHFGYKTLQQKLDRPNQTTTTKNWLKFMLELARWQMRYDVQLDDETRVQLNGEFDIIL